MRVMVTGCTGFIGFHVSVSLAKGGHSVFCIRRFSSQGPRMPEGVVPIYGDFADPYSLARAVRAALPIDVVLHIGALTPVAMSFDQPEAYAQANYLGTVRLLEAIARTEARETVKLVAVAGTTEMYDTMWPIGPETPFMPESPYAVSKVAAVLYAEYMYRTYGLPVTVIIPTNTFGRALLGQRHYFVEKVITSMLEGRDVIELGSPDVERDWLYREDHVGAYLRLVELVERGEQEPLLGMRIPVGTGRSYTTREVFETIASITGWDGKVRWNSVTRANDTKRIVVDPTTAEKLMGWRPRYGLKEGLEKAVEEWRRVLG